MSKESIKREMKILKSKLPTGDFVIDDAIKHRITRLEVELKGRERLDKELSMDTRRAIRQLKDRLSTCIDPIIMDAIEWKIGWYERKLD